MGCNFIVAQYQHKLSVPPLFFTTYTGDGSYFLFLRFSVISLLFSFINKNLPFTTRLLNSTAYQSKNQLQVNLTFFSLYIQSVYLQYIVSQVVHLTKISLGLSNNRWPVKLFSIINAHRVVYYFNHYSSSYVAKILFCIITRVRNHNSLVQPWKIRRIIRSNNII